MKHSAARLGDYFSIESVLKRIKKFLFILAFLIFFFLFLMKLIKFFVQVRDVSGRRKLI